MTSVIMIGEGLSSEIGVDMIVSDAGEQSVNGTYVKTRVDSNNRPTYRKDGYVILWKTQGNSSWWSIEDESENGIYKSTDNVSTPDLASTWVPVGNAQSPMPTFAIAPHSAGSLLTATGDGGYDWRVPLLPSTVELEDDAMLQIVDGFPKWVYPVPIMVSLGELGDWENGLVPASAAEVTAAFLDYPGASGPYTGQMVCWVDYVGPTLKAAIFHSGAGWRLISMGGVLS
jgi:hypothetical protein